MANTSKPSHRHGSPRTERGESTGPKPCKPTTYILTCEFMLRNPVDYEMFRAIFEGRLRDIGTYPHIQVDYIAIEKKKAEAADG